MDVHSNKYGSGATLFINEVLFYLFSGSGVPNEMHRYFNGSSSSHGRTVTLVAAHARAFVPLWTSTVSSAAETEPHSSLLKHLMQ